MKKIRIFLASSVIELEQDRRSLGDFVSNLDEMIRDRGIDLRMIQCEHMSNAMHPERKENDYLEKVERCDYFYVLFGVRMGLYTREEFEAAWKRMKATGAPRIYTYHKVPAEGVSDEASAREFLDYLEKDLKHFCSSYVHLDSVKLNILMELTRNENLGSSMEFRNGQAMLDGRMVLPLNNVPIYGNNEDLQLRKRKLERLNREFATLAVEREQCPEDEVLEEVWKDLVARRAELSEQIQQQEMSILRLCLRISEQNSMGKQLTWREKRAASCFERGDYDGALAILRDSARTKELVQAEKAKEMAMQIVEQNNKAILGFINENRLRIHTLMTKGISADTLDEIHQCYDENMMLALRHGLELNCLYEYAGFLLEQKDYPRGIRVALQLQERYQAASAAKADQVRLWNLLGSLYGGNRDYGLAEDAYEKALQLQKSLPDVQWTLHAPAIRRICNNRAIYLQYSNCFSEADALYQRALAVAPPQGYGSLRQWDKETAMICNNRAILLQNTGRREESKVYYHKALALIQRQKDQDPGYKADIAMLWNNLATLLQDMGDHEQALDMYRQALEVRMELVQENPQAYKHVVAMTRENMATLLTRMGLHQEALTEFEAVLKLRLELAGSNRQAYRPTVALTESNRAILLARMGRWQASEAAYRESLQIRRSLARDNPVAYDPDVALICGNLAVMLQKSDRREEAEAMYLESLEIYRRISAATPLVYDRYLELVGSNLELLHNGGGMPEEAPALRKEARPLHGKE